MSTFKKCPAAVGELAREILCEYDTHKPLLDARVKIDFVFAYADRGEDGEILGCALKHHGVESLGICPLKDRAMGRGDAEISLDGDWWEGAPGEQKSALLDHELHHIEVRFKDGALVTDDLNRPVLKLRKHDYELGEFTIIAKRHGMHSQECIQMKRMMDEAGQYFWPDLVVGGRAK